MFGGDVFTAQDSSLEKLTMKALTTVKRNGEEHKTKENQYKILSPFTYILEKPTEKKDWFPYWDEPSLEWYMDNFSRSKVNPPEKEVNGAVYPYTYAWRLHHNDLGWGHLMKFIALLRDHNYSQLIIKNKDDVNNLIGEMYQQLHPDIILSLLQWQKERNINIFINHPALVRYQVDNTRHDILEDLIASILRGNHDINTFSAPLNYAHIDNNVHSGVMPFLQFHVEIHHNEKGRPYGFSTYHLQSEINAEGMVQLLFAQDVEMGSYISNRIKLPLLSCVVATPRLYVKHDDPLKKLNIIDRLSAETTAYFAHEFDITDWISNESYKRKVQYILDHYTG